MSRQLPREAVAESSTRSDRRMRNFLIRLNAGTQTWLTIFVTTIYNFALLYGVLTGGLTWDNYIMSVGPVNTMVMAFWLGSETAMRQPGVFPSVDTADKKSES
jgi:hypothetical protein